MKKVILGLMLAMGTQSAWAQLDNPELFHEGEASKAVAETMAQEIMTSLLSDQEKISKMNEEDVANMMFDSMKKYNGQMKEAMQKDCAVDNSAKDCACYYEKVDLNEIYDKTKEVALIPDISEEEAVKKMQPLVDDYKARKASCGLK